MYGDDGDLLYVGKAKKSAHAAHELSPNQKLPRALANRFASSTKFLKSNSKRCKSEEAALKKENALLRKLKPPFNVANTSPETYFYFTVKILEEESIIGERTPIILTLSMNPADPEAAVFGAFKGLASSHRAFFALRRLLWLVSERNEEDLLYYPIHLIRRQRLYPHHCSIEKSWLNRFGRIFSWDLACALPSLSLILFRPCEKFRAPSKIAIRFMRLG